MRDEKCADTSVIDEIARDSKVLASSTGSGSTRFSWIRQDPSRNEWNREPSELRSPVYL